MLRKSFVLLVVGMVVFFLCSVASADVPDSINYQGKLTTASGGCLNDTVQMTFTIYADAFGTVLEWSETQTQVEVKEGIFNVLLGSVNPLAASIFDGSAKYLGVQVESDPEMSPLRPMVTTAYAFHSATADSAFNVPAAGIVSVDGVSNPGGDVDFIQNNSITITPNDGANIITFGETHSARSDNPHVVTAAQTNALVSVDGVSNAGGNVDFIAGTNMTITPNDGANTVTFSSTAGGIGGSGTTNYIPKFTASTTLGNSAIYQSGSNIGIGTASPSYPLHVSGDAHITGNVGVWGEPPNSDRGINISKAFYGSVGSKYMLAADVYIGEASGTNYLYGVRGYCRSDSWWGTQYLYGVYGHGRSTQTGGTATHNIYGVYAKGEGLTSGTQTAYGLYATASGGDKNWAGYFDAGNLYIGGNVGIGTTAPTTKLEVEGEISTGDVGIRWKKITGTTDNDPFTNITTGISTSKVLGYDVFVQHSAGTWYPPSYEPGGTRNYYTFHQVARIELLYVPSDLQGRPYKVLVRYED